MWQHWALVVLILSVPVQYLLSKYWTGFDLGSWTPETETIPASYSRTSSNYYLQKTFASLDKKLKLEEWSRWPHHLVQCAKRFLFDYMGSMSSLMKSEEAESEKKKIPLDAKSPLPVPPPEPSGKTTEDTKITGKERQTGSKEPVAGSEKRAEVEEEEFDEDVHFAGSRVPRSPRHPDVIYRVGQVFRHTKHKYRGLIIGWDVRPKVPAQIAAAIFPKDKPELQQQPFYAVLVDTRDRLTPQIDYVPQDYIQLTPNTAVIHPVVHQYFESSRPDTRTGRYIMRPRHQAVYPDD